MQTNNFNITALILAAGSSSRMGKSKQFLEVSGKALLIKTIENVLNSLIKNIVVVLGHNSEAHTKLIKHLPTTIVHNTSWERGMGSSIKAGMDEMEKKDQAVDGVICMVCDQPYLTSDHLNSLITAFNNNPKKIIASSYRNTIGVPVLFPKKYFDELTNLDDAQGAKTILDSNKQEIISINFPRGEIDLDTKEDYDIFLKNYNP